LRYGKSFNDVSGWISVDDKIVRSVRQWVETVVVGLNLCPFAKRELVKNRVRFVVTKATSEGPLLVALEDELDR